MLAMLVPLLTCLCLLQDPAGRDPGAGGSPAPSEERSGEKAGEKSAEKSGAAPADKAPAEKAASAWDDKQAKAALAEWKKATTGSPSMAQKQKALEKLASGSHESLVAPLQKVIETDKSLVLKKRAAEVLGNQPEASKAVVALLQKPKVQEAPTVCAELVRVLLRGGYDPKHWAVMEPLFEVDFAPERMPLQEAMIEVAAAHKEANALPLLLRHLDEPTPANVDAADNPPKEYWEARWKSWSAWRAKVADAVFEITGQRFSSAKEAKAWLAKNKLPPRRER